MLDIVTLRGMRNIMNTKFLTETMEIYSVTITKDAYAQETTTRTLLSTVKGQVSTLNGSEKDLLTALIDGGLENKEVAKFVLPYGTTVDVGNEIKTADNKYWSVTHVGSTQTFIAALEVLVMREVINAGK